MFAFLDLLVLLIMLFPCFTFFWYNISSILLWFNLSRLILIERFPVGIFSWIVFLVFHLDIPVINFQPSQALFDSYGVFHSLELDEGKSILIFEIFLDINQDWFGYLTDYPIKADSV